MEPPRDTGVTLRGAGRRTRPQKRGLTPWQMGAIAVGVIAVLTLVIWIARPGADSHIQAAENAEATPVEQIEVRADDRSQPTPFFADYGDLHLYLPISPDDLTELAFHQTSGDKALSMTSLLPDADMTAAAENHGTGRTESVATDSDTGEEVLQGTALRMWRSNRTGEPNTAADVGAAPGSLVYAPVTGEVVEVRAYQLYEKYDDYEIHIRPEGYDDIDVVMIHVEDPRVQTGDRVVGGVTALASVRCLSDCITHQLSAYTKDGGDHTHLQLNKLDSAEDLGAVDGS